MLQASPPVNQAASSVALPSSFACRWRPDGSGSARVHLSGELDLSTSPLFGETLRDALLNTRTVSIDLQELAFIDCSGLAVLLGAHSNAQGSGRRLVLVRGSGQVDRILKLTGLLEQLEVVDFSGGSAGANGGDPSGKTRVVK